MFWKLGSLFIRLSVLWVYRSLLDDIGYEASGDFLTISFSFVEFLPSFQVELETMPDETRLISDSAGVFDPKVPGGFIDDDS